LPGVPQGRLCLADGVAGALGSVVEAGTQLGHDDELIAGGGLARCKWSLEPSLRQAGELSDRVAHDTWRDDALSGMLNLCASE
jgi:hypothetical protein